MDGEDLMWMLLLLSNMAWAVGVIYMLIQSEQRRVRDCWDVPGAVKKEKALQKNQPAKEKKQVKPKSQEQLELKEYMQGYEKAKRAKVDCSRLIEATTEGNEQERAVMKRVIENIAERLSKQEDLIKTQSERIKKFNKQSSILDDRIRMSQETYSMEDAGVQEIQKQLQEAEEEAGKAKAETSAVKKEKDKLSKKLRESTREVGSLQYKAEGLYRKASRLVEENNIIKREIDYHKSRFRTNRDDHRSQQDHHYGGKGGGKGWKKGGGKGGGKHRESGFGGRNGGGGRFRRDELDDDVEEPASGSGGWKATTPPPSPPAAQVAEGDAAKPSINAMLEKAMANPVSRWIDDFDADQWN